MNSEKTLNVILINENKTIRNALKLLLLVEYNASILYVFDTIDELEDAKEVQIVDVIILDINLAKLDSYASFLNKYKDSIIIAIISQNDKRYYTKLIKLGFKHCMFVDNIYNELSSILIPLKRTEVSD
jgi:PleD family two-component response regulator